MAELDVDRLALQARKEDLRINMEYKKASRKFKQEFARKYTNKILVGEGKEFWIEKRENNFHFHTKIVQLIVANNGVKTTNSNITSEAQKSFPETINKNIWSKKLSSKMKKTLSDGLNLELKNLLAKAVTLSEFKKMVVSRANLKSGSVIYKPRIELNDLVMLINGVSFPIQKNSTTKNLKKHVYEQIRVNLDAFLAALDLKKMPKKKV